MTDSSTPTVFKKRKSRSLNSAIPWIVGGIVISIGLCVLLVLGLAFMFKQDITALAISRAVPTEVIPSTEYGSSDVQEVMRAADALNYPALVAPDPSRQPVFPNVPYGDRPALAAYELPFEDGDYFEAGYGDVDLPQYYYRVMTAGTIKIGQLGVDCVATPTKGCAVILINHFGETTVFRNATVDNGFTIAGRVWDMGSPDKVTLVSQALLDHYMLRMTGSEDGANCGVVTACESVEWHVVVVGNGKVQVHWTGIFHR